MHNPLTRAKPLRHEFSDQFSDRQMRLPRRFLYFRT
jgi:hypothetical protein